VAETVVQIYRGQGLRNWRVRLVAGNGRTLSISEGYFSRWNARRAAARIFPGLTVKEVER
jgi:uncharacterized protein YegP (UPF0339 family)